MANKSARRSIALTPEMRDRLAEIVKRQPRNITESDLIREAIRRYLDEQEDLIGSRRHFQKSFQTRIDRLEQAIAFQLNVITYLIAGDDKAIQDAIIAARRHGETLLAQIQAVRDLEIKP